MSFIEFQKASKSDTEFFAIRKHPENEIAIEILPSKEFKWDYREHMKDLS